MGADEKRKEIKRMYGSDIFRGKSLKDMSDSQIHAIYGQLVHSGKFEEYQSLKDSYISLFPGAHYDAIRRANGLSFFELRDIIAKVLREKEQKFKEGYQFTLWDYQNMLEGEEAKEVFFDDSVKDGYLNKV